MALDRRSFGSPNVLNNDPAYGTPSDLPFNMSNAPPGCGEPSYIDLSKIVTGISATWSMYNGFTATINAINKDGVAGEPKTLLWQPVIVNLASVVTFFDYAGDATQFAGNADVIAGIVTSVSNTDASPDPNHAFTLNLASFASTLKGRTINTHKYNDSIGTVILDVVGIYAAFPLALFSLSVGNAVNFNALVQGSDLYEEIKKMSRAAFSDLFTQIGGIVTVEPFKFASAAVDYVIPDEAIISVENSRVAEKSPTRYMVSGAFESTLQSGWKLVSNVNQVQPTNLKPEKCHIPGAESRKFITNLGQLGAKKKDLKGAGIKIFNPNPAIPAPGPNDPKFDKGIKVGDHFMDIQISSIVDLEGGVEIQVPYQVTASVDKDHKAEQDTKGQPQKAFSQDVYNAHQAMSNTPPGRIFPVRRIDKIPDGRDPERLQVLVQDLDLASQMGVISGDVDNPYIGNAAAAFALGIREFQEFRMQRNTYNFQAVFLPKLRLNQVVTVKLPDTPVTITGRVVSITFNWSGGNSQTLMNFTVESFCEIGSNRYDSSNLVRYPDLTGINGVDWVIDSGSVFAMGGYFGFDALNGPAQVHQDLHMIPGFIVTVSVVLVMLTPGSFTVTMGGVPNTYTSSGQFTFSFVAVTDSLSLIALANSGEWLMEHAIVRATALNQ